MLSKEEVFAWVNHTSSEGKGKTHYEAVLGSGCVPSEGDFLEDEEDAIKRAVAFLDYIAECHGILSEITKETQEIYEARLKSEKAQFLPGLQPEDLDDKITKAEAFTAPDLKVTVPEEKDVEEGPQTWEPPPKPRVGRPRK